MNSLITIIKNNEEENRLIESYGIDNILFLNPLENRLHFYILQIKNKKNQKQALNALSYKNIIGKLSGTTYSIKLELVIREDVLEEFYKQI